MTFDIGFREAREMWIPNWIDILREKNGETAIDPGSLPEYSWAGGDDYPTVLSKHMVTDTGYALCVPPHIPYTLVKKQQTGLVNVWFYHDDGTSTHFPVGQSFPRAFTDQDSVVYVTTADTGPSEKGYLYYDRFGLDRVDIPADCTRLSAVMSRAVTMFNERYAYRMLNSETLEQWQMRLQHTADLNAYRYERALELYATNSEEMSNVLEKKVTVRDMTSQNSGSDSTTYGRKDTFAGTVKNVDTPDSAVNDSDDYADALTKSNNSNTASGTDTLTHGLKNEIDDTVTETKEPEGGIVRATNDSIDAYRDIVADFVREFENNFLNVFWY